MNTNDIPSTSNKNHDTYEESMEQVIKKTAWDQAMPTLHIEIL